MAVKVNYDTGKELYPDAYLRISKIICSSELVEHYVNGDDDELILKFEKVPKHIATVFVYPDREARMNNARALHYFGIEFPYDLEAGGNIYKKAYDALKKVERFKGEKMEDV